MLLIEIEKLIYGGDGLARMPANAGGRGKAVFIPFVLAQEKVEAVLTEEKPGFARAQAITIAESSTHRILPDCPYFTRCGGCHYQHAAYEHQLEIKKEILRESLRRMAKIELQCDIAVHPSPPWNYRNRSRLQVRTRPDFAIGYFKFASHELLPVEHCPISSPLINRAITSVWNFGRAGKVVEGVREIEFFANEDDTRLQIELLCTPEARRAAVRACAEELCAAMPEITGISAFRESQKGAQQPLVAVGSSEFTYKTKAAAYRVSAGSFFQTNRFLTDDLINLVAANRAGELAVDLYAGVGLFSTALAGSFRHILSVEMSQTSFNDLSYNLSSKGKAVHAAAEQFLSGLGDQGRAKVGALLPQLRHKPELVVVDPPRSGLGDRVARLLTGLSASRITYVSCDPATLARDLVPLQSVGYRVEEVHLIDLFPQTYHLESVVQLVR
ncbi:MAG: 23S rRNA (uracil(1939)-C(5))-methyltransferase RlmD [Candidatus Sulfotelmatobacter sp.]|jgi:23S rRNA (uracil1939-C5)-methyltransferase